MSEIQIKPYGQQEQWTKSQLHCPSCGKQTLYVDSEDLSNSSQYHICTSCPTGIKMYLPTMILPNSGMDFQRWCELRHNAKEG